MLRLQRARRLLDAGRGQAETAAIDQAHLSGEFKAMTGCTPREFTLARGGTRGPVAGGRISGEAMRLVLAAT
ncbi:AraC family transcriptional regulator [Streptomyces sp. NBC_00663]|uniref:helix-turn-helix transcriptional regulator n=1 Tax=Streptomyces sp. NBC_00663 TaxID=2975801 RepID=UPI002E3481E4|nr:helix-turn-helix transcriptional regulator [Streptomyces sp. NBC_00663]